MTPADVWPWPGHRGAPTIHTVRVVECAELIAADVFTAAERTRARLTLGDVERHLVRLAGHPPAAGAAAAHCCRG